MDEKTPHATDVHVGQRIRIRRKAMGISQTQLADPLGLTFQQVQKYERGANRVSASKLHDMAKFMQVPIGFFFEGLTEHQVDELDVFADMIGDHSGGEVARLWPGLSRSQRVAVARIVRSIVNVQDGEEAVAAAPLASAA